MKTLNGKWSVMGGLLTVAFTVVAFVSPEANTQYFQAYDGQRKLEGALNRPTCSQGIAADCHRSSAGAGNQTTGTGNGINSVTTENVSSTNCE